MEPTPSERRRADAAALLDARLSGTVPRRARSKSKRSSRQAIARAKVENEEFRRRGDWGAALPIHFVALYAWLHESIYGVEPLDLFANDAAFGASSSCRKLLHDEFNDDAQALVKFIAWCWAREKKRRDKSNGDSTWRITWRQQFASRVLLVDYRVATAG